MNDVHLVLFGFTRDFHQPEELDTPAMKALHGVSTYIYAPTLRYEDRPDTISDAEIRRVLQPYLNIKRICLWEYNKQIFLDKTPPEIPRFNQYYQQAYRIYSCFYHIRQALALLPDKVKEQPDAIIILSRIDIRLVTCNMDRIRQLLQGHDIIVEAFMTDNSYIDRVFVFKAKWVPVMQRLYNDFTQYLLEFHFPTPFSRTHEKIYSWRPEEIYWYHIDLHQLHVAVEPVITYNIHHVCNKFCGHNEEQTET